MSRFGFNNNSFNSNNKEHTMNYCFADNSLDEMNSAHRMKNDITPRNGGNAVRSIFAGPITIEIDFPGGVIIR